MAVVMPERMQEILDTVCYERGGVRLSVRTSRLSEYPGLRVPCCWHDELEYIHILDGMMVCAVNGREIFLNTGDSLIINIRQMHDIRDCRKQDCRFSRILFHPSLFTASEVLMQGEILPVLEHPDLTYWHFTEKCSMGLAAAGLLERAAALKDAARTGYELEVVGLLHILFGELRRHIGGLPPVSGRPRTDLERQKDMVSCIYQNYGRKLTLPEIAAAGHVGRDRCCEMFRQYLRQTPIDFLNDCRLNVGCHLLRGSERSITEIALACGFRHSSYFSKMFLEKLNCTPREYRKSAGQVKSSIKIVEMVEMPEE